MNTLRANRCLLVPTLLVVGLLMPTVCTGQGLLGPGVRGVTIDEAKLRRHVMRPQHLNGVESDKGLDEAADIVKFPPRPIGLPPPHLDVKGFGKAMEAALKDSTAGYIMSLRQNGIPVYTHAWHWAKEPTDGSEAWAINTHMHVASVSKLMTAIAMTKLLNEKRISYDTKIIDYLPAYWRKGSNINKITFRNLMTHTSGFDTGTSHSDYEFMKSQVAAGVSKIGHYHYENMNFGLCRILLSVINGNIDKSLKLPPGIGEDLVWDFVTINAYRQYVTDNVFTPAGVTHATLDHPAGDALAYNFPVVGPGWNSGDLSTMSGAAGWHMSANDLLDVLGTFRRKGTIMTPEKAQEMLDNGFGVDTVGLKTPAGKLYAKNGLWHNGIQAERSWVYFLPENMEMVLLVNSTIGPHPIAQIYGDNLKSGNIPTEAKPTITVNNVTNACGGTLYVSGSGFTEVEQVHITVKNAPGLTSPQEIKFVVGTADKLGKVSIQIPYSINPYSGLPGCPMGSTSTVVVTIIATDKLGRKASTEIYLRNCGITWGACPA